MRHLGSLKCDVYYDEVTGEISIGHETEIIASSADLTDAQKLRAEALQRKACRAAAAFICFTHDPDCETKFEETHRESCDFT